MAPLPNRKLLEILILSERMIAMADDCRRPGADQDQDAFVQSIEQGARIIREAAESERGRRAALGMWTFTHDGTGAIGTPW